MARAELVTLCAPCNFFSSCEGECLYEDESLRE
jgi:radical SAM protein with 4Fe4S-binding SPASM domain